MTLFDIYHDFFLINLNEFSNIGLDLEINKILFYFLIGIIVTTIIYNYRTAGNVTLIKRLVRNESFSEDNAKTLDELKINTLNTRLAANSVRLKRIIKRVGQKEMTYEEYTAAIKQKGYKEEKIDFSSAKFYIHENAIDEAKKLTETNGPTVINTALYCVLMLAVYVFVMFLMPSILTLINNILG